MPRYEAWKERASCQNHETPDIFFPASTKGKRTDTSAAKAVCIDCPVRRTCLVYAIVYRESRGVWGGMGETERKAIPPHVRVRWRQVWYRVYPNSRPHATL